MGTFAIELPFQTSFDGEFVWTLSIGPLGPETGHRLKRRKPINDVVPGGQCVCPVHALHLRR